MVTYFVTPAHYACVTACHGAGGGWPARRADPTMHRIETNDDERGQTTETEHMFGTNELGDEASAEELAEWCGIDFKATDSKLIPVQQYQQTGFVASAESGAEPDPPHVVVANYELPDGSRRVLTSDEYAEILERETTLPEMQAKVHARRVVGQKPDEIAKAIGRADGTVKKHLARISEARSKARDQLEEAQRTLALLDANPSGGDDE